MDAHGSALVEEFNGSWVRTDVMRDGERRSGSEVLVLVLSRGDVSIFGSTSREPAGGGRGGKLDSGRATEPRTGESKTKGSVWMTSLEEGPGYAPDWTLTGLLE